MGSWRMHHVSPHLQLDRFTCTTQFSSRHLRTMSPPNSVPEAYRPGFLPPSIAKQMQENLPGAQHKLDPAPFDDVLADGSRYKASGKLRGKNALVTGGDSGIGRSSCVLLWVVIPASQGKIRKEVVSLTRCSALEGANVLMHYHPKEKRDAEEAKDYIAKVAPDAQVELAEFDLSTEEECLKFVEKTKQWSHGQLHVL